jgi:hypothetical protein
MIVHCARKTVLKAERLIGRQWDAFLPVSLKSCPNVAHS